MARSMAFDGRCQTALFYSCESFVRREDTTARQPQCARPARARARARARRQGVSLARRGGGGRRRSTLRGRREGRPGVAGCHCGDRLWRQRPVHPAPLVGV